MDKIFHSTDEQLIKLKKRGLVINDDARVKQILVFENYYNLINGYKDLFLIKKDTNEDEEYLPNANFNEIYALYLFDRELRTIFLRYILEIENNIKSVISYKFSEKYSHDNYLKFENFNTNFKPKGIKTEAQMFGETVSLITNLHNEIARQLSKNNSMVSHYMLNYGYVPLWVLVNNLSLGTISKFYAAMKETDKNEVAKAFSLPPFELQVILFVLSVFRNACAHDERLYNLKSVKRDLTPNSIKTNSIHRDLQIPVGKSNNPVCGKNDLFAVLIIFKILLSKTNFNNCFDLLKSSIACLEKKLKVISINNVLDKMGFFDKWSDIKTIN